MASLETEFTNVKAAHTRLVDVLVQAEEDANKARSELGDLQLRFSGVAREIKVVNESSEEVQQQSVKSTKAAEEASPQLTKLSGRAQAQETEVSSLGSQLREAAKTRDDATSSAH